MSAMLPKIRYKYVNAAGNAANADAPPFSQHVPSVGCIVRYQDQDGSANRPAPIKRKLRVTGLPDYVYVQDQEIIEIPCEMVNEDMIDDA